MSDRFEKIPTALVTDEGLSLQARAVYAFIRNRIWQQTRENGDAMTAELPPLQDLASAAGCSERALREYVKELRKAGWVDTRRAARGRPQIYTVYARPRPADSAAPERQKMPDSRARDKTPDHSTDTGERTEVLSPGRPRNLIFDAIAETTFANPEISGGEIAKAAKAIRAAEEPEIRERSERFLAENPSYGEVPPKAIDLWLAGRVRERAQLYRQMRPEWELTPSALAKHWNRIPTWQPRGAAPGRMTAADIARIEE